MRRLPPAKHNRAPFFDCPLSVRELAVLEVLAADRSPQVELGLSASTVRSHVSNIYARLGVRCREDAIAVASFREWLFATPRPEPDRRLKELSAEQRLYLTAFDRHLRGGDNEHDLEAVKLLTDVAFAGVRAHPSRSVPSRDWIDGRLLSKMARLP